MKESTSGAIIGALAVGLVFATAGAVYEFNVKHDASQNPVHSAEMALAQQARISAIKTEQQAKKMDASEPSSSVTNLSYTDIPEVVTRASDGKLSVINAFAGPYPNTTGVIAKLTNGKSGKMFLWVITPPSVAKPLLFSGSAFDYTGQNLTKEYLLKNKLISPSAITESVNLSAPPTSASVAVSPSDVPSAPANAPINTMSKTDILAHIWSDPASFILGTKGPMITVFIDPNCIYCHSYLDSTLFPLVKQGKLRVKILPVGFLHPSSLPKAWHLLADGASALTKNEAGFNVQTESGALTGYTVSQANTVKIPNTGLTVGQGVMANNILLKAIDGGFATPTTVVKVNGKLESFTGAKSPSDLFGILGVKG